jgi:hypothetical protein
MGKLKSFLTLLPRISNSMHLTIINYTPHKMQVKVLYSMVLFVFLFTGCNTTRNAKATAKNNYTFIIEVQKQELIEPVLNASMKIVSPDDCQFNSSVVTLRYDSIGEVKFTHIKDELEKYSGILQMKIVKE